MTNKDLARISEIIEDLFKNLDELMEENGRLVRENIKLKEKLKDLRQRTGMI